MTALDRPEWRLAVALAIGLLIGAERERRQAEEKTRLVVGGGVLLVLAASWAGFLLAP